MKKNIIILALLASCTLLTAQNEFDAMRYLQNDINGTARYIGMAGAFGALGGDASSIKNNPAGLGIYRRSEISGTLNSLMQRTETNWQYFEGSTLTNSYRYGDLYKTGANNFSLVIAVPSRQYEEGSDAGLMSSNWSFTYNRLKNFNRNLYAQSGPSNSSITDYMAYFSAGFSSSDLYYSNSINELFNNNIPTLSIYGYQGYLMDSVANNAWGSAINSKVTPTTKITESGYLDEYSVGWAGNFNNRIYFGATLNLQSLNYTAFSRYREDYNDGEYLFLGDSLYSKSTGFNLKIGTIMCPTEHLRIGLALKTPTILSVKEDYYSTLDFNRNTVNQGGAIVAPAYRNSYQIQSPMQFDLSAAYILGSKGLLSAEYNYIKNTGTRLMSDNGDNQAYTDENQGMIDFMNNTNTIRLGGEYKLTNNLSIRAGYAYTNNSTKPTGEKFLQLNTKSVDTRYFLNNNTNYYSVGLGYREANWFVDFAFVKKVIDETFYPYNSNNIPGYYSKIQEENPNIFIPAEVIPVTAITTNNNLVVTLGFKF